MKMMNKKFLRNKVWGYLCIRHFHLHFYTLVINPSLEFNSFEKNLLRNVSKKRINRRNNPKLNDI